MPRFKIFSDKSDFGDADVVLEQSYSSFQVIVATDAVAAELRQRFPIQQLPEPTPVSVPGAFSTLASANDERRGRRDWMVTFRYPVKREWLDNLLELGATVLGGASSSSVVVATPNIKVLNAVQKHDHVQSIVPHRALIDVDPSFFASVGNNIALPQNFDEAATARDAMAETASGRRNLSLPGALYLDFYTNEDAQAGFRRLKRGKVRGVIVAGETRLAVDLSLSEDLQADLLWLFKCPGLRRVEQRKIKQLFNDKAREVIGANVVSSGSTFALTGAGEIVAVADSGLDTGNAQTIHADFRGRIVDIESWPIVPAMSAYVTNPNGDDGASDDFSGHGTHVVGSVLGDGNRSQALGVGNIQGMAPGAQLVFQAIEQRPQWTNEVLLSFLGQGQTPPKSGLYGIPDDLTDLFASAYQKGARIHNNSWGGGTPGEYDNQCMDLDRFVWEHKDMLIVVAAGNSGTDRVTPDGSIDPTSVDSPATAKNCLTVGACENDRNGDFSAQYGQWWPSDFPNPNLQGDLMVDSIDDIVPFSSRGPCNTGRRKPDVVAPGTFVLSTRSSQMPSNNFAWSAFNPAKSDYMFMGGTSMASPLVAGSAALLRQHLRSDHGFANPSAALLKAGLIHSANYIDYRFRAPNSSPFADNEQGWGRVELEHVISLEGDQSLFFLDETLGLYTGEARRFRLTLTQTGKIRITMVYSDAPGQDLINNLNLLVFDPSGTAHIGNDFDGIGIFDDLNNVEAVFASNAATGEWIVQIVASEVIEAPQDFALVISVPPGSQLEEL